MANPFTPLSGDERCPGLRSIVQAQLDIWPEHARQIERSFSNLQDADISHVEAIAKAVHCLAGNDLSVFCQDYKWMCDRVMEEELYFCRYHKYRLATFAEAEREVYSNDAYMERYMRGLLIAHVLWANHRNPLIYYIETFLPALANGFHHLEIGPGHGLFLYFTSQLSTCAKAVGWDISQAAVKMTRHAINLLGASNKVDIQIQDFTNANLSENKYDSIAISEVLEHLEDPAQALRTLQPLLVPGGRMFIKSPVNSPMPDHIYLWRTPEEFVSFVEQTNMKVLDTVFSPTNGYTLGRARKMGTSISCTVVATLPN